jgi:hypothetical protein
MSLRKSLFILQNPLKYLFQKTVSANKEVFHQNNEHFGCLLTLFLLKLAKSQMKLFSKYIVDEPLNRQ